MRKAILICFLTMFFELQSFAQKRQFGVAEVEVLFKKDEDAVHAMIKAKGYTFIERDSGILRYKNDTRLGTFYVNISYGTNKRLKSFLWTEHIIYSNHIASELSSLQYVNGETIAGSGIRNSLMTNIEKGLRILLTTIGYQNQINLNMQLIPVARTNNRPKALYRGSKP